VERAVKAPRLGLRPPCGTREPSLQMSTARPPPLPPTHTPTHTHLSCSTCCKYSAVCWPAAANRSLLI
jgi:hypothetical protein